MGWMENLDREAERDQKEAEAKAANLVRRARELKIDVREYMEQDWQGDSTVDVERLERDIERVERDKRKQGHSDKDIETVQSLIDTSLEIAEEQKAKVSSDKAPEGVQQAMWDTMNPTERQQYLQGTIQDPFEDLAYEAGDLQQLDQYALNMGEDVANQMYRKELLRETNIGGNLTGRPVKGDGEFIKRKNVSTTPEKYISRIYNMNPEELESFQRDLYAAGFYGTLRGVKDEEPVYGAPDEATTMATKLLTLYTMRFKGRLSIAEVLDKYKKMVDVDGDGIPDKEAEDKPKPIIRLTSQTDLAAVAQDEATQLMGRRLQGGEVGRATGGYNQQESAYQFASQTAEIENEGGTFTQPATISAYTEEKIREAYAPEVDSYTYLGIVNALLQKLDLAG